MVPNEGFVRVLFCYVFLLLHIHHHDVCCLFFDGANMITKTYTELFQKKSPSLRDVNNAIRCLMLTKKVFEDKYMQEEDPYSKDHYQRIFDLIDQEIQRIYEAIDSNFPHYWSRVEKIASKKP